MTKVEANMALMLELDEKIEERIHQAVASLFGMDENGNPMMPKFKSTYPRRLREHVTHELARDIAQVLVNNPGFIEALFNNMTRIQYNRRAAYTNTTSSDRLFF